MRRRHQAICARLFRPVLVAPVVASAVLAVPILTALVLAAGPAAAELTEATRDEVYRGCVADLDNIVVPESGVTRADADAYCACSADGLRAAMTPSEFRDYAAEVEAEQARGGDGSQATMANRTAHSVVRRCAVKWLMN